MALYKFFKPSKPSETLATEQNNLSKRENEKVIDELRSVEENKGKRPVLKTKSIVPGHQFREPRFVSTQQNVVTHLLLEP